MMDSVQNKKSEHIVQEMQTLLMNIMESSYIFLTDRIGEREIIDMERSVSRLQKLIRELTHINKIESPFILSPNIENRHDAANVLIVVRDMSIKYALINHLARSYNIQAVSEIIDALNVLEQDDINLIVYDSDIAGKDDIELCSFVKTNTTFSHIPIVLISGKKNSRIEAMELRADAYVEKPFSTDYVNAIVQNLLEIKEKLRLKYITTPWLDTSVIAITEADMEFLKRIQNIIRENTDNSLFCVDDLAKLTHMSRSSLYRKIKGITNCSPNSFIQMERLRKAALLLLEGRFRVNEVCYMVGFNSSSYFTKCFQKQFGILPKDYK